MASTISSPATESSSPTEFQLTPRSKVQALLASLDDDSDDGIDSASARARLVATFTNQPSRTDASNTNGQLRRETSDPISPRNLEKKSELDDGERGAEDILRPKGRMAARMLLPEDNSEGEQVSEDVRDGVNKMLMVLSNSQDPPTTTEDVEYSDENDAPIVVRKRKIRVSRHSTPQSSARNRSASPGLFVSPSTHRSTKPSENASESDELPSNPLLNYRLKALLEKKRQDRLKKEAEDTKERVKKGAERKRQEDTFEEDGRSSDDDVERRLTQQSKPTRKASKRALEDIHRETQRLSRNNQLGHNPITKKRFTTADFLTKQNYRPVRLAVGYRLKSTRHTSSSPAPNSDAETYETPPTSPASPECQIEKHHHQAGVPVAGIDGEDELPSLADTLSHLSSSPRTSGKGQGKAIEDPPRQLQMPKKALFKQHQIRVQPPKIADRAVSESDSDLEIVDVKTPNVRAKKLHSIFDRVPAQQAKESNSLHALRMLAHLTSPGKQSSRKDKKASMTITELQVSLQQRAKQQAAREREERLQVLRDKGVIVQTAEERQRDMAEVEDLVAKARREGEEIMKRERAAAKMERGANGEADPFGNGSDDKEWVEEEENLAEEISGSESDKDEDRSEDDEGDTIGEEVDDEDQEEDEVALDDAKTLEAMALNPMFDNEAEEIDDDDGEAQADSFMDVENFRASSGDVEVDDEDEENLPALNQRRSRKTNIISDDEDEEGRSKETPSAPRNKSTDRLQMESPGAPNSVLRSATKTFIPGLTVAGPAGLGLTQIFAGTMDESQMQASPSSSLSEPRNMDENRDCLEFLRRLPAPELPDFLPTMEEDSQDVAMDSQSSLSHIPESQPMESQTHDIQLQFSQSQIHGFDSLVNNPMATQLSEFPEATQDAGFQHMTPIRGRFVEAPPSTIDTVALGPPPEPVLLTPIVKKKGKLRRRAQVAAFSDDEGGGEPTQAENAALAEDFDITANAFNVMRKASTKKEFVLDDFDKKKSKAKDMVHEQAEESEDEYAGLGGASDDESGGEDDAYAKEIIDDEGGKDVDESKLAAFFADRERANDEKQVEKLYNDITKGMLRRNRGADYDLSDSDDGGEARRRMKRKEFTKMRKALLADERIGKIAENPKRQAFLRAIEDRRSDDEMGFLDDFAELDEATDSQSQSQIEASQPRASEQGVADSQPPIMGQPKRKRSDDASEAESRLPPHLRRTNPTQKPSNLAEIRESLSSLIEEPNTMATSKGSGSDTEEDLEIEGRPEFGGRTERGKENRNPFALRRTSVPVIDRISLKRASSSNLSTSTRLAFAANSSTPGFKVPPLLRRATTNNSLASTSSSANSTANGGVSAMERMAGGGASEGIKRGGGKNSGVHYFARESERRAAVVKTEKRKEQKRSKGAEVRRKVVGGLFGGGKFE